MTRSLRNFPLLFALSSLIVLAAAIAIPRSTAYARQPEVLAWAITFDLTISIPLFYALFVVRRGRASKASIAPVALVCLAVAALLVPRDQQQFLHQLRYAAIPLDVLTIAILGRKLLRGETKNSRVLRAVRSEIEILWYALFAWRKTAEVPSGATAVTVHQRSGWSSIVVCFLVVIAAESLGVHLLLSRWSSLAAWIVTGLDIWSMLWLIGDYHALRLRPTLIDGDRIELRYGLRWNATIERANIAAVEPVQSEADWKRRGVLKMAMLDEPRWIIRLHEPITLEGLAGLTKTVDAIAIRPDDEETFLNGLSYST